jgi:hypothetical protein
MEFKATPYLKQLVAGFPPRRSGFAAWSGQVGFVVSPANLYSTKLYPHNHPGQEQYARNSRHAEWTNFGLHLTLRELKRIN